MRSRQPCAFLQAATGDKANLPPAFLETKAIVTVVDNFSVNATVVAGIISVKACEIFKSAGIELPPLEMLSSVPLPGTYKVSDSDDDLAAVITPEKKRRCKRDDDVPGVSDDPLPRAASSSKICWV